MRLQPYLVDLAKTFGLSAAASGGMLVGIVIAGEIFKELNARNDNKTFTEIIDNSYLNSED